MNDHSLQPLSISSKKMINEKNIKVAFYNNTLINNTLFNTYRLVISFAY
jgi:hypothetical protein